MIQRTTNPEAASYRNYGAKGVRVCDEWTDPTHGYDNFLAHLGPKPHPDCTLDRRDGSGDYTKENCRWADPITQLRNKKTTKLKGPDVHAILDRLLAGDTQSSIAQHYGVSQSTISNIRSRYLEDYTEGRLVFHY
jgi:Homeodomain-like domain